MPITFTPEERTSLLRILRNGRQNATGARELSRSLGYPTGSNQVKVRQLIKECIENDSDLICAATGRPAGFFKPETITELETYVDSLENRTRRDNDRRTALISNWNNQDNRQETQRQTLTIQ